MKKFLLDFISTTHKNDLNSFPYLNLFFSRHFYSTPSQKEIYFLPKYICLKVKYLNLFLFAEILRFVLLVGNKHCEDVTRFSG